MRQLSEARIGGPLGEKNGSYFVLEKWLLTRITTKL